MKSSMWSSWDPHCETYGIFTVTHCDQLRPAVTDLEAVIYHRRPEPIALEAYHATRVLLGIG